MCMYKIAHDRTENRWYLVEGPSEPKSWFGEGEGKSTQHSFLPYSPIGFRPDVGNVTSHFAVPPLNDCRGPLALRVREQSLVIHIQAALGRLPRSAAPFILSYIAVKNNSRSPTPAMK